MPDHNYFANLIWQIADLWHVATALYVSPRSGGLSFATLDAPQSAVAEALGFPVPYEASLP